MPTAQEDWRGVEKQLAVSPRIYLFENFLSDDECDYLISHVRPQGFGV